MSLECTRLLGAKLRVQAGGGLTDQASSLPVTEEKAEAWKKEGTCPSHN